MLYIMYLENNKRLKRRIRKNCIKIRSSTDPVRIILTHLHS